MTKILLSAVFCLGVVSGAVAKGPAKVSREGREPGYGLHQRPEITWYASRPGEKAPEFKRYESQRVELQVMAEGMRRETSQYDQLFLQSLPETSATKSRSELNSFDSRISEKLGKGELSEVVMLMRERDVALGKILQEYNEVQGKKGEVGVLYAESPSGRRSWYVSSALPPKSLAEVKGVPGTASGHDAYSPREMAKRFQPNRETLDPLAQAAITDIARAVDVEGLSNLLQSWWLQQKDKSPNSAGHAFTLLNQIHEMALMQGANGRKVGEIIEALLGQNSEGNDFYTVAKYLENGGTERGKRVISGLGAMAAERKKISVALLDKVYDPGNRGKNILDRIKSLSEADRAKFEAHVGEKLFEDLNGSRADYHNGIRGHTNEKGQYIRPLWLDPSGKPLGEKEKLKTLPADLALYEVWVKSRTPNEFVDNLINLANNGHTGADGKKVPASAFEGLKRLRGIDTSTPEGKEKLRAEIKRLMEENEAVAKAICTYCPGKMDLGACQRGVAANLAQAL